MKTRIEAHPGGMRWIRGVAENDRSQAIDALFGDSRGSAPLLSLTFHGEPGPMEPHYHTGTIVAAILGGRLALDVGDDISERFVFEPGDIVYVPVNLYHGEEILDREPAIATVVHLEPFEIVEERPDS